MNYLTAALLLLSSTLTLATPTPNHGEKIDRTNWGFEPGLTIPVDCYSKQDGNACPAKLASKNALLTSVSVTLHSLDGGTHAPSNALRAGFKPDGRVPNGLVEESTLTLFDFPEGHHHRECRFHFVTDDGDNVPGAPTSPNIYNVWSLVPHSGVAGETSTWWNKPSRDLVVATFFANQDTTGVTTTENKKYLHKFLYGPGHDTDSAKKTFKCPKGGKVVYEVASAIKAQVENGGINIGGHNSLGIEILGLDSEWYKK